LIWETILGGIRAVLGVCYYPEHWPEDWRAEDPRRMRELGLAFGRIGEFAWSGTEPRRDEFKWGWLHRAMNALGDATLKIVLGTPTAAPPRWLMDEHPGSRPSTSEAARADLGLRRRMVQSPILQDRRQLLGAPTTMQQSSGDCVNCR
jgi:beta-galactosidase